VGSHGMVVQCREEGGIEEGEAAIMIPFFGGGVFQSN